MKKEFDSPGKGRANIFILMQIINLNTAEAERLGFTPDKFGRLSYLQKDDRAIILALVVPRVDNAVQELVGAIKRHGMTPFLVDRHCEALIEV